MPRTPEANEFVKETRRKQILKVSLKLFCEYGYDAVTMDQIAKASNISHGLVYHYFTKKSDILANLMKISTEKFGALIDKEALKTASGYEFFEKLTEFIISSITMGEEYAYFINLFLSFRMSPTLYAQFGETPLIGKIEENFRKGQEDGIFAKGNPKEFLLCYFYLVNSIAVSSIQKEKDAIIPSARVVLNILKRSYDE